MADMNDTNYGFTGPDQNGEYCVELDFVDNDGPDGLDAKGEAKKWAEKFGVRHEVILEVGPAGGWPVVKFTGTRNAISELIDLYDNNGDS